MAISVMDGWGQYRSGARIALAVALASVFAGLATVSAAQTQGVGPAGAATTTAPIAASEYFATTTQLSDPLRPLQQLPASATVRVRAIVATIPDPVETHLGRSFDMALSAALTAYQSQRYVLDGYAFPWKPVAEESMGATPPKDAKDKTKELRPYRNVPGVLVFRRDAWRSPSETAPVPADYLLVFLVGEAPSYGVHQTAFEVAARCAAAYNRVREAPVSSLFPDLACDDKQIPVGVGLDVLGPSFSGSMQSVALAIGRLREEDCRFWTLPTVLLSASATVGSNEEIEKLQALNPVNDCTGERGSFEYVPIAWSLDVQFEALRQALCAMEVKSGRVVVLAEESTFGRGAEDLFETLNDRPCVHSKVPIKFEVRPFSPNISSIRAEHSALRSVGTPDLPGIPKTRGRLLELDMTSTRNALDRPITYEPGLTSRSDELMLYRTFDALRNYTEPEAVVILATDVRDRLFLLGEVRKALPNVLPVMMELDYLAIHPDYRAASRGALIVAAGDATACLKLDPEDGKQRFVECQGRGLSRFSFPTDFGANVFRAARMLVDWRDEQPDFSDFRSRPALPSVHPASMWRLLQAFMK